MNNRVLFLANHAITIYNFRRELVKQLIKEGYEVHLSAPYSELIEELKEENCIFHDIRLERHGTNPVRDFRLILSYQKLIKEVNPVIVFTYTIKPNIYGGIAAAAMHIPQVANITGLGSAVQSSNWLSKLVLLLYRFGLRKAKTVYFQNNANMKFFYDKKIAADRQKLLPGSGVNLNYFVPLKYPSGDKINFVFVSRIMKEKGIEEYLETAASIKRKYPHVRFHICGFCEEAYEERLEGLQKQGIIEYHGLVQDMRNIYKDMHCVVLPSYHEGMSNVLLEAAACARPVIASDIPGCREIFEEGKSGLGIKPQNTKELIKAVEAIIQMTNEQQKQMGTEGRKIVERKFDRQIVVNAYIAELGDKIL